MNFIIFNCVVSILIALSLMLLRVYNKCFDNGGMYFDFGVNIISTQVN